MNHTIWNYAFKICLNLFLFFKLCKMGVCCSIDNDIISDQSIIEKYITEDCNFRKNNGSSINLDKQLRIQRIEIICMGCFLYKNKDLIDKHDIEILIRDKVIGETKYRPDLIYKKHGKVYHIEIDENSHSGYDKDKESDRYEIIKSYCITTYGSYNLIRFNPNVYGKLDDEKSKLKIADQFVNLLNNIDGLLQFEKQN